MSVEDGILLGCVKGLLKEGFVLVEVVDPDGTALKG